MDDSLVLLLITILVAIALVGAYRANATRDLPVGAIRTGEMQLPFWTWLFRRLMWFRMRRLVDFEWASTFSDDVQEIEVTLFVERRPARFEFTFPEEFRIRVDTVSYERNGSLETQEFAARETRSKGIGKLSLDPIDVVPTRRMVFRLIDPSAQLQGQLAIKVMNDTAPDLAIVHEAHQLAQLGRIEEAILKLREYEVYSRENPLICYRLAEWYREREELDEASEYAARAVVRGNVEMCSDLYRTVQGDRRATDVGKIRRLQDDARQWSLGTHLGVVVLERRQLFSLGLSGGQLRRCREILEIRRPAAARMMRQIAFSFSESREVALHTSLRVVHATGDVEDVPLEHFTVSDHESKNIYITVEGEKSGHWILPDLSAGDVIEWTYDLLHRDRSIDLAPQCFALSSLFHEYLPTFHARNEYAVPDDLSIRFAVRNLESEPEREDARGKAIYVFEGSRFVPAKGTGFPFENVHLNPVICCAAEGIEWEAVAREALRTNFGETGMDEPLPPPLREMIEPGGSSALEKAFYWTRDKLKYASFRSGGERIGDAERARKIVEAGIGDCKDKTHLLALVCRDLALPCEFLAVSTKNGIVIEELPADQFDHVLLRAEIDGEWAYLDATNPLATFGSPPAWCQGLSALKLNGEASIVGIPTDPPEANVLEIEETLDRHHEGRIEGRFALRARGQSARLIDENWKAMSLMFDARAHAAGEALRHYLPTSFVAEHSRKSDTSESGVFHVEGHHSRGPLVTLGRHERVICTLSWDVPFLPIAYWRTLQIDRLFAVELPTKVSLVIRLEGEMLRALKDISSIDGMDNSVGSVDEEVTESPDATTIRRTIVLRKRLIEGDDIELIPESFDRIEKAMQLVLVCDPTLL
jgi:hypothetical protein